MSRANSGRTDSASLKVQEFAAGAAIAGGPFEYGIDNKHVAR